MGRAESVPGSVSAEIGALIEQARRGAGLSVEDLAARARCSPDFLAKVVNGDWIPSAAMFRRLTTALGAEVDEAPDSAYVSAYAEGFDAGMREVREGGHQPIRIS
jgi:transcriptional regulator with XRE-family HTH domain